MMADPAPAPTGGRQDFRTLHLPIAGSRPSEDEVTYPDIDLHYSRRNGLRSFSHKDGTSNPGWPKETNR